jgi:hypothetical protein
MRFAILVAGGVATGALSMGVVQTMVPRNSQMLQAVGALGGDPASFKIGDINPLKAYQDVKRQITSGRLGGSIDFGSATPISSFPKVGDWSLGNKIHLDDASMRRAIAAGINSRVEQDIRRAQDLSAYSRNPMAWHGAPPH